MKITFIANGCAIYESQGFHLVSDPWLTNGAFEGSWCHYPPLRTSPEQLARQTDALYISHIHPDHFDPLSLAPMRKDIPVVILDHNNKFLQQRVRSLGFTQVLAIPDARAVTVGPFRLTLLAPFDKHNFFGAEVGNLIDSAIVVDDGEFRVLNCNDNIPRAESAASIARQFGPFDLVQVQYCAAGPYPSCFDNLGEEGKYNACSEVQQRYLKLFVDVARAMRTKYAMPFAGDFVLGGRQWRKNRVLGTVPAQDAARRLQLECPETTPVLLSESMSFDLATGATGGAAYQPWIQEEALAYIESELASLRYPYELDRIDERALSEFFTRSLPLARTNFGLWQQRLGYRKDINVYLELHDGGFFHFNPTTDTTGFVKSRSSLQEPYLKCSMDARLLRRIVEREAHWNNAEGGCHIDFERAPNVYDPDLHTMLSFLHVAAARV